ncbi:GNAT family N-acetyltransferase [Sphingomonas sp. ASY06-1R]|uniref:GNAT family N-acetyltransferase n=1 Tax=Sphingomonas sp. ASY06-1R TaxID=3445771 RepID=UPI003FA26C7E
MAADPALLATWIKAWAITRSVAPPISYASGHFVAVNQPDQRGRYVFATLDEHAISKVAQGQAPWVYLKVCEQEEKVRPLLPARWQIRSTPTCMMIADLSPLRLTLPEGYQLSLAQEGEVLTATIRAGDALAARGRLVVVDGMAIFDQIRTQDEHQRRGLGRALMAALTQTALERQAGLAILSATAMGRALYESVGWRWHSPYTSAVIPADGGDAPIT